MTESYFMKVLIGSPSCKDYFCPCEIRPEGKQNVYGVVVVIIEDPRVSSCFT